MAQGPPSATAEKERLTNSDAIREMRAACPKFGVEHELRIRAIELVPSIAALAALFHKQRLAIGELTATAQSDGRVIRCRFNCGSDVPLDLMVDELLRLPSVNSVVVVTRLTAASLGAP